MVVFGSVVYDGAIEFLDDFINSINKQTFDEFDVLLINDNIESNVFEFYANKIIKRRVYIIGPVYTKTPAELRVMLVLEAKKRGYDLLVLGDCDDTFESNRIEYICKKKMQFPNYCFYYNNLCLKNGESCFRKLPNKTLTIDKILQFNYLGLSNNAINISMIDKEWIYTLFEFDSFVFDWYLFSRILLSGGQGILVDDTFTIYRLHENNFVGVGSNSTEMIRKEYIVKKKHYCMLAKYSKQIADLYGKINRVDVKKISSNRAKQGFWWSNIIL